MAEIATSAKRPATAPNSNRILHKQNQTTLAQKCRVRHPY
jgi:hypothetical protein